MIMLRQARKHSSSEVWLLFRLRWIFSRFPLRETALSTSFINILMDPGQWRAAACPGPRRQHFLFSHENSSELLRNHWHKPIKDLLKCLSSSAIKILFGYVERPRCCLKRVESSDRNGMKWRIIEKDIIFRSTQFQASTKTDFPSSSTSL